MFIEFAEFLSRAYHQSCCFHKYSEILEVKAQEALNSSLTKRIHYIIAPILLKDLHLFILENHEEALNDLIHSADTFAANKEYEQYIESLKADRWRSLCEKYPLQEELILQAYENWKHSHIIFLERFCKDIQEITEVFLNNERIVSPKISNLKLDQSDPHNKGKTVITVYLQDKIIVYKPKSLSSDVFWKDLCNFLKQINSPYVPIHLEFIAKEDYGWCEFIASSEIENIPKFLSNTGSLLAIFYVLASTDMHEENFIFCKDEPILIDHESILQPKFINPQEPEKIFNSINSIMVLPIIFNSNWNQRIYIEGWSCIRDLLKDELKHKRFLMDGFETMYLFLMQKKEVLISYLNTDYQFEKTKIRFIYRSTETYSIILSRINKFTHLASKEEVISELRAYESSNADRQLLDLLFHEERQQLLRGDIPYFITTADSKSIRLNNGLEPKIFQLSPVELLISRLKTLCLDDLKKQKKTLSSCLERVSKKPWQRPTLPYSCVQYHRR
ncbi:MAG: DUF4135 domain-containing protein, partial [Chlamydiae bacterium]|nr:DUF4135 domain-containing protein [Chlamydiota bacterium]